MSSPVICPIPMARPVQIDACGLLHAASERLHDRIAKHGGFALNDEEAMRRVMSVAGSEHGEYDFNS